MNLLVEHARLELEALVNSEKDTGESTGISHLVYDTLELIKTISLFSSLGNTNLAPIDAKFIANTIEKLLLKEHLVPIMGTPDEWVIVDSIDHIPSDSNLYQNKRCGNLFKVDDNPAYYLDAVHWKDVNTGSVFTGEVEGVSSIQSVSGFPFFPKTYTVAVRELGFKIQEKDNMTFNCFLIMDTTTIKEEVFKDSFSPTRKYTGRAWYKEYFSYNFGIDVDSLPKT